MKDPLTNSWIVYNGEIYNFRELRAELEKLGVTFKSKSDTEVLLQALVKWGEGALTKLSGMYAFGFWDGIRKELLLARDPLGIKPLYYFDIPGLFIFGSEVKVIQASNLRNFTLDKNAVRSFLTYGAVIRPLTIINEIKELLPGSVLKVSENGEIKKITKRNLSIILNESEKGNSVSFSEAVNSIKSTLLNSVKSHLVSDVPVGVFLSGGIDSSLISLFVLNSNEEQDVKLLTVGFPEEEFSEVKYSRIVAEKTHRDHEVIFVTTDRIQNLLPKALSSMDQPTVDGINTYVISNVASSLGIKVLLSGLGGDELFGGYTTYRNVPLLLQYHKIFPKLAKFMVKIRGSNLSKWHKVSQLSNIDTLEEIYLLHRCIRWKGASGGLQNGDALPDNFFIPHEIRETLLSGDDGDDFKNITLLELNFYMGNQLLRDSDVFSMANSVELRVPFLDIDVVRRALTLPKSYHQQFWKGKKITREILKEICPGLPLNRKKMGFTFPWESWLRGDLKEMISETLFNKTLYKNVGLDFQEGKKIFGDFLINHPLVSWYQIWSLFTFLNWQERNRISV
jgi:asparagine synthase (glutamine-hydrolysing)